MANSIFFVVPIAFLAAANKLWELRGLGPNSFSVPAGLGGQEPASHWYGNYENMPPAEEAAVRGLRDALPDLPEGESWGANGYPAEQDALDAAQAFGFYIRDDPNMTAVEHKDAILAGLGLQEIEPEL